MTDNDNVKLALIGQDIKYIKKRLEKYDRDHVSKTEFTPVKNVVYGLVGLILSGVVGAVIALVIR